MKRVKKKNDGEERICDTDIQEIELIGLDD